MTSCFLSPLSARLSANNLLLAGRRSFTLSGSRLASNTPLRALVYSDYGDPHQVVKAASFQPLPPPAPTEVSLQINLSPINPADLNVIEGVYPSRPTIRKDLRPTSGITSQEAVQGIYVGGNEGVATVLDVGSSVTQFKKGDRVIFDSSQSGSWASHQNASSKDLVKVKEGVSDVHAATMKINPPTAWGMLVGFIDLTPGEYIIQNGANSSVGQAAIQIAHAYGLKTINLVRDRPDIDALKGKLKSLGADHVLTYEELADKNMRTTIKDWTGDKPIRLGLNCVGGKETSLMAKYLGQDAHLVSYGAMSKSPLSLPTSLFIFKNLTSHGYWQSRWYDSHSHAEHEAMLEIIMELIRDGKLRETEHEIVHLKGNDETATQIMRDAVGRMNAGRHGKKVLLKWSD